MSGPLFSKKGRVWNIMSGPPGSFPITPPRFYGKRVSDWFGELKTKKERIVKTKTGIIKVLSFLSNEKIEIVEIDDARKS
jgi:hypothetical protein